MVNCNVGDFGHIKFKEITDNKSIWCDVWDFWGTITKIRGENVEIRDNDSEHIYKTTFDNILEFDKIADNKGFFVKK